MNRRSFILDSTATLALGATRAWAKGAPEPPPSGPFTAGASFRIEDLPLLRDGVETHQFCSYDRSGDNNDWNYFPIYTEADGQVVIFDAMGPGCLYRHHMNIWNSWGGYDGATAVKGVNIRYYFDGEERPRIDMDVSTFFSPKNPLGIFRYPLAVDGGRDFRVMYCPMFFKKRLKVALSKEPGGPGTRIPWTGRYDKIPRFRGHWYEYTFHTYREDPGIESWRPGQQAVELFRLWNPNRLGQDPKPALGNKSKTVTLPLPAGKRISLNEIAGAGSLSSIRLSIEPVNEETLFRTWLKITADNVSRAQVEAPLGAFFGANRKSTSSSFSSLLLGYSPASMYCYFPMPYWSSIQIELENRGAEDIQTVNAAIQYKPVQAHPYMKDHCGYFFAHYHKEFPRREGIDYTYLAWIGTGHVVGHVVSRFNTSMEEDERTYFDGSRTPQIYGEGFEDDHDMGWGLKNIQHPIFGAMDANGGSGTVYRFFIPDLYCFHSSVKHGHQVYGPHTPVGGEGMYQIGDEESVTFFYGRNAPSLVLSDELDLGNQESLREHAYQSVNLLPKAKDAPGYSLLGGFWYAGELNNVLFNTPPIQNGGITFNGHSQFRVNIDPANQGVRIRRRMDKSDNRQTANVYVDGALVGERPWYSVDYDETFRNIRWQDTDFEIPRRYTAGKSSILLRIEYVHGENLRWNEYRYWIFSILPATTRLDGSAQDRLGGLIREEIQLAPQANFTRRAQKVVFFAYR